MAGAATALRLGAPLALAGTVLASTVLLLPGIAVVLLVAGCWGWVRLGGLGLGAGRTSVPARVSEGERFDVVVEGVSGWLPLAARIDDEVLGQPVPLRVLRPRSGFSIRFEASLPRRGNHSLPAPRIRIADPFGIAERRIAIGGPSTVLVLPRIDLPTGPSGAGGPALGLGGLGPGESAGRGERESTADPELEGVRPYRPGTRATRIYWPSLARGADLAERHLAAAGDAAPLVVLDPSGSRTAEDLDAAIRAAASLTVHLARLGMCELLIGGARRRISVEGSARARLAALVALAVVEPTDRSPRLPRGEHHSSVIWVAAHPAPRMPPGIGRGFVVTPEPMPGRVVAFTVSGCSGHAMSGAGRLGVAA